ncbi:MAG: hypothetical protein M3347_17380, partial [Armatimonadota bacterium]|nr:hypothetical protein [Armatimonadota bacterium]
MSSWPFIRGGGFRFTAPDFNRGCFVAKRHLLVVSLLALISLAPCGFAQTAPSAAATSLPNIAARLPKFERVEGTVSTTSGGVTSRARLQFQAPDQLRIDVQPDEAALIPAQTVIAGADDTRLFNPSTKRVQRLPYNVAKQWWRGWSLLHGGPANVALTGLALEPTQIFYKAAIAPLTIIKSATAPSEGLSIQFRARDEVGKYLIRDFVRTGGVADQMFYAAFKRPAFDRPAQIDLALDPKTNRLLGRTEMDTAGRALSNSTLTLDAASGLPQAATARDVTNNIAAQFTYDLKPRSEPFPADTFSFERAPGQIPGQIVEDQELQPLAAYEARQDADAKFNLGVALARHIEDFPAAFAAWDEAARLQPQAVAPHFASYELALRARDLARAQQALDQLSRLLGKEHVEVLTRAANLAALRRDWAGAATALEAAQRAQTQNLGITLLRADLARVRGDFATARNLLLDILKSNAVQPATQVAAAEMFAAIALQSSDGKATEDTLAGLPGDTEWQRLARGILSIRLGKDAGQVALQHPAARVALALAREQAPEKPTASTSDFWATVARQEPLPLGRLARLLWLNRAARDGDVAGSLAVYRELIAQAPDESTRDEVRGILLSAWQKAFRLDQLRAALQQRGLSSGAGEEEARLWLAFQTSFGSTDDIAAAIQAGLARFPRSAWWHSLWTEHLMNDATSQPMTQAGVTARETIIRNALRSAQNAMQADPSQPYYQTQHAIILAQRSAMPVAIIDPGKRTAERKAALDALSKLQQDWKDDPDVEIAVAIQRLALALPEDRDEPVRLLQKALRGGAPGRETISGDRHEAAFIARQALAGAMRENKKPLEAAHQFETALATTRSASEEFGIVANLLNLSIAQKNTAAIPELLVRVAREPWPFEQYQQLMDGSIRVITRSRPLALDVAAGLIALNTPHARLVLAHLHKALLEPAQAEAAAPNAPLSAATFLQTITRTLAAALQALEPWAGGDDKLLTSRAAVLLGDDAFGRKNMADAIKWMRLAVELEPRDVNLRVALATAYQANSQKKEATAVRDDMMRALPRTVEN